MQRQPFFSFRRISIKKMTNDFTSRASVQICMRSTCTPLLLVYLLDMSTRSMCHAASLSPECIDNNKWALSTVCCKSYTFFEVAKLMSAHLTLHNICSLIVDYMRGGVVDDGNVAGC